ncbi:DVUA0089 family protein [Candidatus Bipolaricaulota bacterium]
MKWIRIGACAAGLAIALSIAGFGQCYSEIEPNDSSGLADVVASLPGSGCIEGSIDIVGDVDFYYFTVDVPRWVLIETVTNEDTEIALLDSDSLILAQNDDVAVGVISSGIEQYLIAGTYYVAVWEHNDDNVIYAYTLTVSAEGCALEVEPNDAPDLADPLSGMPGEDCISGSIGIVGDIDFFRFEVLDWTILTISTVTNEDTEITLFDEFGAFLASNDDYVVGEYWSWLEVEVSPGNYYVVVEEHGNDNVIYDYTLIVTGTSCVSEIEPNDDDFLADSLGILPGQLCASGSIDPAGDLDYFTFDVDVAGFVVLWTEATGDTEIALFDEVGNLLEENDDVAVDDTSSWIGRDLPAGVYFVAVREFTGADWIPSYTLYVEMD